MSDQLHDLIEMSKSDHLPAVPAQAELSSEEQGEVLTLALYEDTLNQQADQQTIAEWFDTWQRIARDAKRVCQALHSPGYFHEMVDRHGMNIRAALEQDLELLNQLTERAYVAESGRMKARRRQMTLSEHVGRQFNSLPTLAADTERRIGGAEQKIAQAEELRSKRLAVMYEMGIGEAQACELVKPSLADIALMREELAELCRLTAERKDGIGRYEAACYLRWPHLKPKADEVVDEEERQPASIEASPADEPPPCRPLMARILGR